MIELRKWNYETHTYEPFESPAKHICFMTENMDDPTDCANCGKTLPFGDTYTSKTIHTPAGLGFPVCSDCYEIEVNNESEKQP